MVDQLTVNQRVIGSSPIEAANFILKEKAMSQLDLMKDVIAKAIETVKTYNRVDDEGAMINSDLCESLDELAVSIDTLHYEMQEAQRNRNK